MAIESCTETGHLASRTSPTCAWAHALAGHFVSVHLSFATGIMGCLFSKQESELNLSMANATPGAAGARPPAVPPTLDYFRHRFPEIFEVHITVLQLLLASSLASISIRGSLS